MEQLINLTCALGLKKYADLNNFRLFRKISEDLRRFLKISEEFSTLFWSSFSHVKDILFTEHRYEFFSEKKTSKHLTVFFPETVNIEKMANLKANTKTLFLNLPYSVNCLYSGHCRDLELMSSLARVRNSGNLFQSNICNLFFPGI